MKDLSFLLQHIGIYELIGSSNRQVEGITFDSRKVNADHPDILFVAQRGTHVDGHRFIGKVIEQGGKMIVCEEIPAEAQDLASVKNNVTFIKVPNSDIALGLLASAFYDFPSEKLHLLFLPNFCVKRKGTERLKMRMRESVSLTLAGYSPKATMLSAFFLIMLFLGTA